MDNKSLNMRVGFFLVVGIALLCGLILFFGNVFESFKPSNKITVVFPDASGLLKGAAVRVAGARVGSVTAEPYLVDGGRHVEVPMSVERGVVIRNDARFTIGTSGLLGDSYVAIQARTDTAPPIKDGDTVPGDKETGIGDLAARADPLISKGVAMAEEAQQILEKINDNVLTPGATDDIKESLNKVKQMLAKINDETLTRINSKYLTDENADEFRDSLKKLKAVLAKADGAIGKLDDLLTTARNGKGPLGMLLNDSEAAANLKAIIANVKKNGVVFYSDDSGSGKTPAPPPPPSAGRKGR